MSDSQFYLLVADTVLVFHVLFAAFVVIGLILVFIGQFFGWCWVRNPWFRFAHLACIGVVTLQSWLGWICPLTHWEKMLRSQAGDTVYAGSFVSHLLQSLLYYRAPAWAFVVCYTLFALLVIVSWVWVRPHPFTKPV